MISSLWPTAALGKVDVGAGARLGTKQGGSRHDKQFCSQRWPRSCDLLTGLGVELSDCSVDRAKADLKCIKRMRALGQNQITPNLPPSLISLSSRS